MWFKQELTLDPLLRGRWRRKDIFTQIFRFHGQVFRQQKNRKTLRITINGKGYFIKMHKGVGWREIFKNLFQLRWPVLGARNEWQAIKRLNEIGVLTTKLVGYGCRGRNPAQIHSFIVTEELLNTISLEDFCRDWLNNPPDIKLKRGLIDEVAGIASTLHTNGVNHRDFYLCHFLLDVSAGIDNITSENLKLYLIDLHRAQVRKRTPARWIIKDLAGLYFSSMELGLRQRDILRFIKAYTLQDLHTCLLKQQGFWKAVTQRGMRLYGKEKRRAFAANEMSFPNNCLLQDINPIVIGERLLRKIPNKRWVMQARWGTKTIVVKFFMNWRHAQRELTGYEALVAANIVTPKLLHHGWIAGEKLYVLLFEYIATGMDFNLTWQNSNEERRKKLLQELVALTIKMHQAGLQQRDLHLQNFLFTDEKIYTLDPANISKTSRNQPLTETAGLKNLGLLFAQLPARYDDLVEMFYRLYTNTRGIIFTGAGLATFKKWIERWRAFRLQKYQRKVMRSTSRLICRRGKTFFSLCERSYDTPAMRALLAAPDSVLASSDTQILKAGNSATLGLVIVDGQRFVIKRYNIKDFWHGIKRAIQPSRAAISWRNAHLLELLNIATPKPIAMLEKRWGFLRKEAYYISEYCEGIRLQDYFQSEHTAEENAVVAKQIKDLFADLDAVKISHGDLKATNIVLVAGKPMLLDLDAMRLHRWHCCWQRASERDQERFLQNWQMLPNIAQIFCE